MKLSLVGEFIGRNEIPKRAQHNVVAESTCNVVRQPYSSVKNDITTANANVPTPDAETAIPFRNDRIVENLKVFTKLQIELQVFNCIPVANARRFSKYVVTAMMG